MSLNDFCCIVGLAHSEHTDRVTSHVWAGGAGELRPLPGACHYSDEVQQEAPSTVPLRRHRGGLHRMAREGGIARCRDWLQYFLCQNAHLKSYSFYLTIY